MEAVPNLRAECVRQMRHAWIVGLAFLLAGCAQGRISLNVEIRAALSPKPVEGAQVRIARHAGYWSVWSLIHQGPSHQTVTGADGMAHFENIKAYRWDCAVRLAGGDWQQAGPLRTVPEGGGVMTAQLLVTNWELVALCLAADKNAMAAMNDLLQEHDHLIRRDYVVTEAGLAACFHVDPSYRASAVRRIRVLQAAFAASIHLSGTERGAHVLPDGTDGGRP